jgi:hypothetical protein
VTAPLDAPRPAAGDDTATVTARQLPCLLPRLDERVHRHRDPQEIG